MKQAAGENTTANGGTQQYEHVAKAVCQKIDGFFPNTDCQELIFGPGFSAPEMSEIKAYTGSKNLNFVQRFHAGAPYFCISDKVDLRKVVLALKNKGPGEVYGRYTLEPKPSANPI